MTSSEISLPAGEMDEGVSGSIEMVEDACRSPAERIGAEGMDGEEFELRKRLPRRLPRRRNDVYISRKTNFKAQVRHWVNVIDHLGSWFKTRI